MHLSKFGFNSLQIISTVSECLCSIAEENDCGESVEPCAAYMLYIFLYWFVVSTYCFSTVFFKSEGMQLNACILVTGT